MLSFILILLSQPIETLPQKSCCAGTAAARVIKPVAQSESAGCCAAEKGRGESCCGGNGEVCCGSCEQCRAMCGGDCKNCKCCTPEECERCRGGDCKGCCGGAGHASTSGEVQGCCSEAKAGKTATKVRAEAGATCSCKR